MLANYESAILFLEDDAYIARGYLKFSRNKDYYHSWICFTYDNVDYVFDPCLNILCLKELYDKVFEVKVKGIVSAKKVKDYFISSFHSDYSKEISFWQETENPYTPMYRNGCTYKADIENHTIKRVLVQLPT